MTTDKSIKIKIGDEIITDTGVRGFVDSICDCEYCAERGFYEPTIRTKSGDIIYMTDTGMKNGFVSFYKIGTNILGNLDLESSQNNYEWCLEQYEISKKKLDEAKQALDLAKELKAKLESLSNGE